MLIIASANHPKVLDSAILQRPGRFDRIIEIANPDIEQRQRYITKLYKNFNIRNETINWLAENTKGFSMAFIKELFIVSATKNYMDKNKTPFEDNIKESFKEIKNQFQKAKDMKGVTAGFHP